MSDVLIGTDTGSGSSKAVLTTVDGRILATATRPRRDLNARHRAGATRDRLGPGGTHRHPNPITRYLYDILYRGYCDLYSATKTCVHQLAQLQEQQAIVMKA